jgi:hypothetical protein
MRDENDQAQDPFVAYATIGDPGEGKACIEIHQDGSDGICIFTKHEAIAICHQIMMLIDQKIYPLED